MCTACWSGWMDGSTVCVSSSLWPAESRVDVLWRGAADVDASQCTHPASMRGVGGGGAGLNGGAAGLKEVVETVMSTAIPSEARPSPPSGGGGRSPLPKGLNGLSQVAMLEATDGRSSSRGLSAAHLRGESQKSPREVSPGRETPASCPAPRGFPRGGSVGARAGLESAASPPSDRPSMRARTSASRLGPVKAFSREAARVQFGAVVQPAPPTLGRARYRLCGFGVRGPAL